MSPVLCQQDLRRPRIHAPGGFLMSERSAMSAESKVHSITVEVNVDTSNLEKAVVMMERLAVAAQAARDSIVTFNGLAIAADDIVTCELRADETPRMILAELKALRGDLADQRECVSSDHTPLFPLP
jgi:hypothetical protein